MAKGGSVASHPADWSLGDVWPGYVVAAAVAALVGVADILTRYKDNPLVALSTWAAVFYVVVNGLFGLAAYWLSIILNVVQVDGTGGAHGVDNVRNGLIVGFGATIILRAVAFKLSIGGRSNEVGPSTIVDSLLATFDQSIGRTVAGRKDRDVRAMMTGVSFEKAKDFVPTYCLSLLEQDDQLATRVGLLVKAIGQYKERDPAADAERAFLLGNSLINVFGYTVALSVIRGFRAEIMAPEAGATQAGRAAGAGTEPPAPPQPALGPVPDGVVQLAPAPKDNPVI